MREALAPIVVKDLPSQWSDIDMTLRYQSARKQVFETCRRVALPVQPGDATLLHRLTIHGVAPWGPEAIAAPEGRRIAYFRPEVPPRQDWVCAP